MLRSAKQRQMCLRDLALAASRRATGRIVYTWGTNAMWGSRSAAAMERGFASRSGETMRR